ncbi:MAG: Ig-like domain-containing protein [Bdellovibrionia bacterium]
MVFRVLLVAMSLFFVGCTAADVEVALLKVLDEPVRFDPNINVNGDNSNTVPVSGNCKDGSSSVEVTATDGASSSASVTIPCTNGRFTGNIDLSSFPDGPLTITLATGGGTEVVQTINKDSIAPTFINSLPVQYVALGVTKNLAITVSEDFAIGNSSAIELLDEFGQTVSACALSSSKIAAGGPQLLVSVGSCSVEGTYTLRIRAGAIKDLAGNENATVSSVAEVVVDLTAPLATFSTTAPATVSAAITIDLEFSELVQSLNVDDFEVVNASLSLTGSGISHNLVLTPLSFGPFSVTFKSGRVRDLAGNFLALPFASVQREYDSVGPVASVSLVSSTPDGDGRYSVRIQFNRDVQNFVSADVQLTNANLYSFLVSSSSEYLVTVNPATTNGVLELRLPAGSLSDLANNLLESDVVFTWLHDSEAPSVMLTETNGKTESRDQFSFTVMFNEPVVDFNASKLSSLGWSGSFSGFVANADQRTYSFNFVPDTQGSLSLAVPASIAQDSFGNSNSSSGILNLNYDSIAPSVVSFSSSSGGTGWVNASTLTFLLVMSESIEDLSESDFELIGLGSISSVTEVSGKNKREWLIELTLPNEVEGSVQLKLKADAARDLLGNRLATESFSGGQNIDRLAPSLVGSLAPTPGEFVQTQTAPVYGWSSILESGSNGVQLFFSIGTAALGVDILNRQALSNSVLATPAVSLSFEMGRLYYPSLELQDAAGNIRTYQLTPFTYLLPPTVTGVEEGKMLVGRKSPLKIYGTNFFSIQSVHVGGAIVAQCKS